MDSIRESVSVSASRLRDFLSNSKYDTKIILVGTVVTIWISKSFVDWLRMKNYFKKLNIPGPTPLPLFGNFDKVLLNGFDGFDMKILKEYNRTCGIFEGSTPIILTSDPSFIKDVMIKDSWYFTNHRRFDGLDMEPFTLFLSDLRDDEWKNARAIVSTTFTSGKLKDMSKLFNKSVDISMNYLNNLIKEEKDLDIKELFTSFVLDTICSSLFGIEINSINDKENELSKHLRTIFESFSGLQAALFFMFPKIGKFLSNFGIIEVIPSKTVRYLSDLSKEIIGRRRAKLETRTDFMQIMVDHGKNIDNNEQTEKHSEKQATDGNATWKSLKKTLSDSEILAQAILFLFAGLETTSLTATLACYYLALNPESQDKLVSEINEVLERHDGKITYDSVNEMKYMDMVIAETLRLCPASVRTDRISNADYEWNGMKIPKGSVWNVSIWAVHHDPEFYPEPEKFRPERFSDAEKKSRPNEVYLPFGAGPRMCIGMRFAMINIKFLLAALVRKYEILPCEKTPKKLTIEISGLGRPVEKIILKFKSRETV